jgi:hypothetical protein
VKKFFLIFIFSFIGYNLFAQSPLENRVWSEDPYNIKHNGLSVSQWFRESSGRAIVLDTILTYWLYDTYYKNNGYGGELYQAFIEYVESLGWTIDYETIRDVNPNPDLADSVKSMMKSRGYDVSFTLVKISEDYAYYVVNNFDKNNGIYSTRIYELF